MVDTAVVVGSGLFCVSGTALGAALVTLGQQLLHPRRSRRYSRDYDRHETRRRKQRFHSDTSQGDEEESEEEPMSASGRRGAAQRGGKDRRGRSSKKDGPPQDTPGEDNWDPRLIGFSMEEARQYASLRSAKSKERSPAQVLEDLQRGNSRFWMGAAARPEKNAFERRSLIGTQFPSVAVLGCSDSRVPVEIVFDQGLGDIFVVRVAGNCLDQTTTASLQYAVAHLKVKVVVVMGHEGCGAVKAAALPLEKIQQEPTELAGALQMLKGGLDEERLQCVKDARAHDREAVVTNVRRQVERLTKDKCIMSKVCDDELILVGAFYEISSGIVDFFLEVTEGPSEQEDSEPETDPKTMRRSSMVTKPGLHKGVAQRLVVRGASSKNLDKDVPPIPRTRSEPAPSGTQ